MDGVLDLTVIYRAEESDAPTAIRQEETFHTVFSTNALPEDELALSAEQVEPSAVTGDRVELKYILRLNVEGVRKSQAEILTEASPVPASEIAPGMILYYLQPGEEVWDIAKRYRVSMEDIRRLNSVLSDTPAPGTPVMVYKKREK